MRPNCANSTSSSGRFIRDSLIFVNSVRLCGYCSIEGSYAINERLARSRAEGFRDYLNDKYALSSHFPVEVKWVAEDWAKLRELVEGSRWLIVRMFSF